MSRYGTVAVVGRPNVGKSTLVNALVGFKVSIVAPKPQTTRHRILGVVTREGGQLALIDTPGLHAPKGAAISRWLNRAARQALAEADAIALVVEARRWTDEDQQALDAARAAGRPVVLVINKIDRLEARGALLPMLAEHAKRHAFAALVPVSAAKGSNLDALFGALLPLVPEGEPAFEADAVTDRSERFLAAERIREQLVRQLHDELPFAITVEIEAYEIEGDLVKIAAVIWVEREGQKAIVVGKGGEQAKAIGTAARKELERLLDARVLLKLWVRVREHWSDDEAALRRFGYGE